MATTLSDAVESRSRHAKTRFRPLKIRHCRPKRQPRDELQNAVTGAARDTLLLSLANDFRRYFFDHWRVELAQQRNASSHSSLALQFALIEGKLRDVQAHLAALEQQVHVHLAALDQQVKHNSNTLDALYECIEMFSSQCDEFEQQLGRVAEKRAPIDISAKHDCL